MWHGDHFFLLGNLVQKDFKVRYRNMSLGVLWAALNPLVTMGVLTFVFTIIFPSGQPHFPVFVLCGLVPFNFFTMAWASSTSSLLESAQLIKRVPVPREIVPVATVFGNSIHLGIQIALLIAFTLGSGLGVNRQWLWMPLLWGLEIVFVCGLALTTAALNVYVRDTRYVVESINVILFWLVPIFYSSERIPPRFRDLYALNPVAALTVALRQVLMEGRAPSFTIVWKLAAVAVVSLVCGVLVFRKMKRGFYDYL